MASKGTKSKKIPLMKKAYLLGIISFFAVIVVFSVKAVYAYYNDSFSFSILANLIGDFDVGDGDINLMIYKQTVKDAKVFTRSYTVPQIGYKFNPDLTSCSRPCEDNETKSCKITCSTDPSADCHYSYDPSSKNISLTSIHKVTCKFYFEQESESDIKIYIMKEDVAGDYTYSVNSKEYSIIESIPAYGYIYVGSECEEPTESLNYNANTKKFSISTKTKNTCYAYFDQYGSADVATNVFVQSEIGGTVYERVDTIPANNVYILSTNKDSWCYDADGNDMKSNISYDNGYINIEANSKQTCDVYLDLTEN